MPMSNAFRLHGRVGRGDSGVTGSDSRCRTFGPSFGPIFMVGTTSDGTGACRVAIYVGRKDKQGTSVKR